MNHMLENLVWVEKYRPRRVADTILPDDLKKTFQTFVDQQHIPNLILSGGPGIGKTTIARAMMDELGCDYIIINGSMNGNIDTLRNEILNFASSISLGGARKICCIDEADYLNSNSTQPALRNFMEEFSRNCGFIMTCNFKNRIITPLHSRCSVIEFSIPKGCKPKLATQFLKRVEVILDKEGVRYERQAVGAIIQKFFPDWRRVLNELQRYSATGAIDSGILTNFENLSVKQVLAACKQKDFDSIRKWVHENSDEEQTNVFRSIYEAAVDSIDRPSIDELVVILADYQ